jgi:raffinose/stachyose/melibiose transport system permease protein
MAKARSSVFRSVASHAILLTYTLIALAPVIVIVVNSLKKKLAIFNQPLALPWAGNFDPVGYFTVFSRGNFPLYFFNSFIVTVGTVFLVILFGAMAAFALSEYRYRLNTLAGLYLSIGIMIPIRLGTNAILQILVSLGLISAVPWGPLLSLVLVYTAAGLPLSIFILSEFMRQVSNDLKNAARIDGMNEYKIFFVIVFPLIRPALATVAVFTLIPVWNDLWFPLILAPSESTKTVTLGAQIFVGQYQIDWNAVLASLSLAIIPVLVLYIIFSRQLIRGITSGAVK